MANAGEVAAGQAFDPQVTVRGLLTATLGVAPVYLVGASAVFIGKDLGTTVAAIGTFAAVFFGVAGFLGKITGDLVHRLGDRRGLAVAPVVSGLALVMVACAPNVAVLMAAAVIGGLGHGIAQPAVNQALSSAVQPGRLGLAFGVKQSSVPLSSLLGGVSVPAVASVFGWRVTFLGMAACCAAIAAWAARRPAGPAAAAATVDQGPPPSSRRMWMLASGYGLGAAAATSLGVFFVSAAVDIGYASSTAGILLGTCSLLGVAGRVAAGWLCDTHVADPYTLIVTLLVSGSVGYLLLGGGPYAVTFVVGAVLAYSGGFSWPGVFHYAIVRDAAGSAAAATGFAQTGSNLGAGLGPIAVGLTAARTSFTIGWLILAGLSLAGATLVHFARKPRVDRPQDR